MVGVWWFLTSVLTCGQSAPNVFFRDWIREVRKQLTFCVPLIYTKSQLSLEPYIYKCWSFFRPLYMLRYCTQKPADIDATPNPKPTSASLVGQDRHCAPGLLLLYEGGISERPCWEWCGPTSCGRNFARWLCDRWGPFTPHPIYSLEWCGCQGRAVGLKAIVIGC